MQVELKNLILPNQTVAVALSGGADSVALLYYMLSARKKFPFTVKALNVEHGIRGDKSLRDSEFARLLCKELSVELLEYSVDSISYAKEQKLSIEQSARKLRYDCFFDAIEKGFCDKVATAHHMRDNAESVLFNLFRGSAMSGLSGIKENYENKIIRPFLSISKTQIENYIKDNGLKFVTDETNFDDDYTRNYIRLNILPQIKSIFPEVEQSIYRLSQTATIDNEFLDLEAEKSITASEKRIKITLPLHPALLARATVKALKFLGVTKDWEKAHIDAVINLSTLNNGAKINLLKGVEVAKEYGVLTFYRKEEKTLEQIPFSLGEFTLGEIKIKIEKTDFPKNLKDALYLDLDKIPKSAVVRFRKEGDLFTKFGGGTKPLGEYLTDIKIPLRERDFIPVLADGDCILAIFALAISEKVKVDNTTKNIIKIL